MRFLGLCLLLLFGRLALAAGKAHAFETVITFEAYKLLWMMNGKTQGLVYPLFGSDGKPIATNAGVDGGMMNFREFLCRYTGEPAHKCQIDLDIDNPVRTGEVLVNKGLSKTTRVPDIRGVPEKDLIAQYMLDDKHVPATLKLYNIFNEDLVKTFTAAAQLYGTGPESPAYKEIASARPLIERIQKERFKAMRSPKSLAEDFGKAFFGKALKPKDLKDPADFFKDKERWQAIKEKMSMAEYADNDPRILTGVKDWIEKVGREPRAIPGPEFVDISQRHFYVLKGWEGMMAHLQCQIKKGGK